MAADSDVVLLGTGLAPLIAAGELLAAGKSVLILNPDSDFFLEDSELPVEPLLPGGPGGDASPRTAEAAFEGLKPFFPGLIEFYNCQESQAQPTKASFHSFHDERAPHLRQRSRLWIADESQSPGSWEKLESWFLALEERGLRPQLLEGLLAARRFPGTPPLMPGFEGVKGMLLHKSFDVDVSRFRNGVLEFVRERLGSEGVVCNASQIELMPGGLRYHANGMARTTRITDCALVFWTPRMSPWILAQAREWEASLPRKRGVRLWEQWSLLSREPLDPSTIGVFGDLTVWAEIEGAPPADPHATEKLAALRPGPLLALEDVMSADRHHAWAGESSFAALADLCRNFLRWERFSVRSLRPRLIFEDDGREPVSAFRDFLGGGVAGSLRSEEPLVRIVERADGPLVDVVLAAQRACEAVLASEPGSSALGGSSGAAASESEGVT